MARDPQHDLVEFLAQKENFRVALESSHRMEDVRKHVRRAFMSALMPRLADSFADELADGWRLERLETTWKTAMYPGICLTPPTPAQPRYVFRIEQDTNLYHGIWSPQSDFGPEDWSTAPHGTHAAALEKKDFTVDERRHKWLCWKHSWRTENELDKVLLKMVEQEDEMIRGVVQSSVKDFRDHLKSAIIDLNSK